MNPPPNPHKSSASAHPLAFLFGGSRHQYADWIVQAVRSRDRRLEAERREAAAVAIAPLSVPACPPPSNLNPVAAEFRPGSLAPASSAPAPAPPSGPSSAPPAVKTLLVYTSMNHLKAPWMHPPEDVLPLLRDLPAEHRREGGAIELHRQWVIQQLGYGHFCPGKDNLAVLKRDSWVRTEGVKHGLPARVVAWLCGEPSGGIIVLSAGEAAGLWGLSG